MDAKRDALHTPERIVAALQRLWNRGASPSLDEVAAEAGVGIATLYRHFPNRIALEKAALTDALSADLEDILTPDEPGEELVIRSAVDLVDAIHRHIQSLNAAGMVETIDDILRSCAERLGIAMKMGQDAGVVRADLTEPDLFWLLRMLVLGLQHPDSTPELRSRYVAMLAPMMLPSSKTPPEC